MTPQELDAILERVARGELGARSAIAQLIAGGEDQVEAEQAVFIALGGGDLVDTDERGRDRYVHSGKLVREVAAAMRR